MPWLPARQGVGHGCMKGWPPYLMEMALSLNGGVMQAVAKGENRVGGNDLLDQLE